MKMRLLTTVNGRGPSLRGTVHVRYLFMSEGAKCVQGSLRRARVLFFSDGNGEVFSSEVWDAFIHRRRQTVLLRVSFSRRNPQQTSMSHQSSLTGLCAVSCC
jgi:hypothetical protein